MLVEPYVQSLPILTKWWLLLSLDMAENNRKHVFKTVGGHCKANVRFYHFVSSVPLRVKYLFRKHRLAESYSKAY